MPKTPPASDRRNQFTASSKAYEVDFQTEEATRKNEALIKADPFTVKDSVKVTMIPDRIGWRISWYSNK